MSEADLKAQFAVFGVETVPIGEASIRVFRVLPRGMEKAVRAVLQRLAELSDDSRKMVVEAMKVTPTDEQVDGRMAEIKRQSEAIEQEMLDKTIEGIKILSIDDHAWFDDLSMQSASEILGALRKASTDGLAQELQRKFPTNGG